MSRGVFFGQKAKDFQRCMRSIDKFTDGQAAIIDWDEDFLDHVTVQLKPNAGLYEGGRFDFKIQFSERYPEQAPVIRCLTNIYHPNVNMERLDSEPSESNVCFSLLDDWTEARHGLEDIINGLLFFLNYPNLRDPWAPYVDSSMSRRVFKKRVRQSLAGFDMEEAEMKFTKFVEYDKRYDQYTSDIESDYEEEYEDMEEEEVNERDAAYFMINANVVPVDEKNEGEENGEEKEGEKSGEDEEENEKINEEKKNEEDKNGEEKSNEEEGEVKEVTDNKEQSTGQQEEKENENGKEDKEKEEEEEEERVKPAPESSALKIDAILTKVDSIIAGLQEKDYCDDQGKKPTLFGDEENTQSQPVAESSTSETDTNRATLSRQDTKVLLEEASHPQATKTSVKRCMSVDELIKRTPRRSLSNIIALSRQETVSFAKLIRTTTRKRLRAAHTVAAGPSAKIQRLATSS